MIHEKVAPSPSNKPTFIGHGEYAPSIMYIIGMEFIGKGHRPPNRLASFAASLFRRISRLNHKALDVAMEGRPIVGPRGRQGQEIEGGARRGIAKDFHLQIPDTGVNGNGHCAQCARMLFKEGERESERSDAAMRPCARNGRAVCCQPELVPPISTNALIGIQD